MRKEIDTRSENDKEIEEFRSSISDNDKKISHKSTGLDGFVDISSNSKGLKREAEVPVNNDGIKTGIPDEVAEEIINNYKNKKSNEDTLQEPKNASSKASYKEKFLIFKNNLNKDKSSNIKNDKNSNIEEKSSSINNNSNKENFSNLNNNSKKANSSNFIKDLKYNLKKKNEAIYAYLRNLNSKINDKRGSKEKKSNPNLKKAFKYILIFILSIFILFSLYSFIIVTTAPKIHPEKIYKSVAQTTKIYDDSGNEVDKLYYTQDRTLVSRKDIPDNLVNAYIALEDKTFYKHHGFNWTRMVGAVLNALTGSDNISGTSTITQQLARNVYLPEIKSQRSIRRKILEMYYADQIEKVLDKDQIIEAYLNTIYLGFGNYGIQTAAKSYFSKDVKDLSLIECASLAALPQAPDSYALIKHADANNLPDDSSNIITRDPETYIANDISKGRRNTCLKLMKNQGYIDEKEFKEVYDKNLIDFINPNITTYSNIYTYFSDYMIDEIIHDLKEKYKMSEKDAKRMIYTGGLKIYSTLDSKAQQAIANEFSNGNNFPDLQWLRKDRNGNIISDSGEIILYSHDNIINKDNNIVLGSDEFTINKDGSITIKRGNRLNIYTTKSGGVVDYSLELKHTYIREHGVLYTYAGGFINIPAKYKSLDENDDLLISKDFFIDNKDIYVSDSSLVITQNAYTLPAKTVQPQAAMAIVEVGTGQIKAMMGGRETLGKQLYNRATGLRQPGSSIKPLGVYGAALQKSKDYADKGETWPFVNYNTDSQGANFGSYMTTGTHIMDQAQKINGKTWPTNADRRYHGAVTLRRAIQQSLNVPAVKIQLQVGNEYSANIIKKFGITSLVSEGDTSDMNPAALALGGMTKGVSPLEMAQAYAAFPNGGVRQSSISYTKVVNIDGKTILKSKSKSYKVLDEGVAWIMTDLLKSVVSNGIGSSARLSGVSSGGKTGTTSDSYDVWFDGFTPKYAGVVWIGSDVNIALAGGSYMTARLWGKIMGQIPKALEGEYKKQPDSVIYYGGDYYSKGTEKGVYRYVPPKPKEDKEDKDKEKKESNSSQSNDTENQNP